MKTAARRDLRFDHQWLAILIVLFIPVGVSQVIDKVLMGRQLVDVPCKRVRADRQLANIGSADKEPLARLNGSPRLDAAPVL
jgi:hypothetical protein